MIHDNDEFWEWVYRSINDDVLAFGFAITAKMSGLMRQ